MGLDVIENWISPALPEITSRLLCFVFGKGTFTTECRRPCSPLVSTRGGGSWGGNGHSRKSILYLYLPEFTSSQLCFVQYISAPVFTDKQKALRRDCNGKRIE